MLSLCRTRATDPKTRIFLTMILPALRNVYQSVFYVFIGMNFMTVLPAYGQSDTSEPQWGVFEPSIAEGDYSFLFESPVPEVLTTTRLRQPKSKVPGTTTVLQGELIRQLGILNLVEVFRLVPGMTVAEVGSNKSVTSYHGTVAYDQRRLQVQIDGRTAYQPNLAGVEWHSMPVAIESIERIEISRGPNAAAYGINAFLGTINIITKSPEDTQGVNLHTSYGRGGHKTFYGSVGDVNENYQWRLAYQRREDDGFDFQIESSIQEPFNDGYSFNLLTYDANKPLGNGQSLDIRLGVTKGVDKEDRLKADNFETQPNILIDDYYLQTRWNVVASSRHFFHLQASYQDYGRRQRWRWCPDGFGRCFTTNQDIDESRLELELQDTLAFTPDVRLVSGLDYRQDRVESDTYFNGVEHNYQAPMESLKASVFFPACMLSKTLSHFEKNALFLVKSATSVSISSTTAYCLLKLSISMTTSETSSVVS